MSTVKHLGKISNVTIGTGGYQDAMFGISFTLSFDGCSAVSDFWGAWGPGIEWSDRCKWTEADREKQIADSFWRLAKIMEAAKVSEFRKLEGVPIEVELDGMAMKSWRVLKEVL